MRTHWFLAALTLSSPAALAQEVDAATEESADGGQDEDSGNILENWKFRPYLAPDIGVVVFTNGQVADVGASRGAQVGFRYNQKEGDLYGRTRLAAAYLITNGGSGTDIRLGTFFGWRPKLMGAEAGLDVFNNRYNGTAVDLAPTTGVDIPLTVELGPQQIYLIGGIIPTLLGDKTRRVDWPTRTDFGFGHEFAWLVGAVLNAGPLNISAIWTHRVVAGGTSEGLGIGLGIGF